MVIDVNKAITDMFGYTKKEMLTLSPDIFIAKEFFPLVKKNILEGNEEPYQVVAIKKDGSTFPAEIVARHLIYNDKNIRVTSFRDITQSKKLEHESRARYIKVSIMLL